MSLSRRLSHSFSAQDQRRGVEYWREGQVAIEVAGPDGFQATVTGTYAYDVVVDWSDLETAQIVYASCDCPRFGDKSTCKHVWAAVLLADQTGLTAHLPGDQQLYLASAHEQGSLEDDFEDENESDFGDDIGDDLEDEDEPGFEPLPTSLESPPRPPTRQAGPRSWQRALEGIARWTRKRVSQGPAPEPQPPKRLWLVTSRGHAAYEKHTTFEVPPVLYSLLLPRLCESGRLLLVQDGAERSGDGQPLSWDARGPWRFRLVLEGTEKSTAAAPPAAVLRGELYRGEGGAEETRDLFEPVLLFSTGLVVFHDSLALIKLGDTDFQWILALRPEGRLAAPASGPGAPSAAPSSCSRPGSPSTIKARSCARAIARAAGSTRPHACAACATEVPRAKRTAGW